MRFNLLFTTMMTLLFISTSHAGNLTTNTSKSPGKIHEARTYVHGTLNKEVLELSAMNGHTCIVPIDVVKKAGMEVSSLILLLNSNAKVTIRCYPEQGQSNPADFGIYADLK